MRATLLVLLLCASCGQSASGNRAVGPQGAAAADVFSATFSSADAVQIYVRDFGPTYQRLLEGSLVSQLADVFQQSLPDLADVLAHAPKELAVAVSPATVDALDHLGLGFANIVFSLAAHIEGLPSDAKAFRATSAQELANVRGVSLAVTARFSTAQHAKDALDWLTTRGSEARIAIQKTESGVSGTISPREILGGHSTAVALAELGLADGPRDAGMSALAGALDGIAIQFDAKLDGAFVRIDIGEKRRFREANAPGRLPLVYVRWQLPELRRRLDRWARTVDEVSATKTGRQSRALAGMVTELGSIVRGDNAIPNAGQVALHWDKKFEIEYVVAEKRRTPSALSRIPGRQAEGLGVLIADDRMTMVSGLSKLLDFAEQRLAPSFGAVGNSSQARLYYDITMRLRSALRPPPKSVLSGPSAIFVRGDGRLEKVGGSIAGIGKSFRVGVDIPEIAFVSKSRQPTQARAWIAGVGTTVASAVAHANRRGDRAKVWLERANLGWKEPTYDLRSDLWGTLAGVGGLPVVARIDGTLRPHWVEAGDFVIFSTSPRLTRQILYQVGAEPVSATDEVGAGYVTGVFVAQLFSMLQQWARLAGQDLSELNRIGPILGKYAGVSWRSRHANGTTRTEISAR